MYVSFYRLCHMSMRDSFVQKLQVNPVVCISILMVLLILYSNFGAYLRFSVRYSALRCSSATWCTVQSTEVTCGGDGELTQTIVQGSGAYGKWTKALVLEGVHTLKSHCFQKCSSLKEIEIANTVQRIENYVFDCCVLETFYIHSNLTFIASAAFNVNSVLTKVDVSSDNPSYASRNGLVLSKDLTILWIIPPGLTECTIPNTVTVLSSACGRWGNLVHQRG